MKLHRVMSAILQHAIQQLTQEEYNQLVQQLEPEDRKKMPPLENFKSSMRPDRGAG